MPRCNLTLKQKSQIIEASNKQLSSEQIAKKFHVHPTTITRIIKNKSRILAQASRVNTSFKTVQTNGQSEQHDNLVLDYIRQRQISKQPVTIKDICDKAVEFGQQVGRHIKSKRGWWRRFKTRCQIVKSKLQMDASLSSSSIECQLNDNDDKHNNQQHVVPRRQRQKAQQSVIKNAAAAAAAVSSPNVSTKKMKVYTYKVKETISGQLNANNNNNASMVMMINDE